MRSRPAPAFLALFLSVLLLAGCEVRIGDPSGEFEPDTPGVLTVATERVPMVGFWTGTKRHPTGGFEYGLAEAMAERFGLDRVEIRTVPFERIIEGDLAGADIGLRQLTPTGQRGENLDFSIPYISTPPAALVRAGTQVPDLKEAKELEWVVPRGTTLVGMLEELVRPDSYKIAPNRQQAVRMVADGTVDAALFDLPVALALAEHSRGRLEVAAQFHDDEGLAVALPEGSPNREAVNSAIRALTADGTISDLAEEWLGTRTSSTSFQVPDVPLIR